jgi:hypothetical protein
MASTKKRYTPADLRVATWIATVALPIQILQGQAFQPERKQLETALIRLREWGNPPSNWYGIWRESSEGIRDEDVFYLEYLKEEKPDYFGHKVELRARTDSYVGLVASLAKRWRFADNYGANVIHSVVRSLVIHGGRRLDGPAFLSDDMNIELKISINPYARYDSDEPELFPNILRPFHPEKRIPTASLGLTEDDSVSLNVRVRDLVDLQEYLPDLLAVISEQTGLDLRKTRTDAHEKTARNVRWFYQHHCEGKTTGAILREEEESEGYFDPDAISKGIAQVRSLLANPKLRLS